MFTMTTALLASAAILLDWWWGEARKHHPLIYFGTLAHIVETKLNSKTDKPQTGKKIYGVFAIALLILPLTAVSTWLATLPFVGAVFAVLILYLSIGHKSLHDHARSVVLALDLGDEDEARRLAGHMVSRDTKSLHIAGAVTESVLENGNDAVFGALFWFAIAGAPGAMFYRLSNTLDAMWGYRNAQFKDFGWAAARLDDLLNYIPARITALTYALLGKTTQALQCWRYQAAAWKSPNAGPVMATGAGALSIIIGGPAYYQGKEHQRPTLGAGVKPAARDIERALTLVRHGVWLWFGLLMVVGGLIYGGS